MIALFAVILAAAPQLETLGSVDGPFLMADVHVSVDSVVFRNRVESLTNYSPLGGLYESGNSVIAQGQLVGGWGVPVLKHRLAITVSAASTGVLTSPHVRERIYNVPRFEISPVLISAAVPLPIEDVVLVPILGVTIPTRNGFELDPVVSLQPQFRFRVSRGPLIVGANALVNLPVVNKWRTIGSEVPIEIRCPADESRCRWPVTRELWRVAFSAQGEYWFTEELSVGLRTKLELREEDSGLLVNASGSPEGAIVIPHWSVVDLQGAAFGTWAFSRFVGLSASFGLQWQQRTDAFIVDGTGWNASLFVWFRTDSRLSRFWLDH